MQKTTFWSVFLAAAILAPLAAGAATVTESVTLILPSDSSSYTLSPSNFGTLTVNNSTFDFALSGGSQVNLSFAGEKTYTTSGGSTFSSAMQIIRACNSSASTLTIKVDSGAGSDTVTVTPSGACSGASSGGGGGSPSVGGSGGGGGSAPFIPAQVAQTPAPSVPAPAAAGFKSFANDLALGMKGDDVLRLQALLASDKEIYPEGTVSGYFGNLTAQAVKRFQTKHKLPSIGRVGPATRAKLAEIFGEGKTPSAVPTPATPAATGLTRELGSGSKGDDVTALQEFLAKDKDIYPEGSATGYYGSLTTAAVRRFQAKYGISQVGRVGPATLKQLQELMSGIVVAPVPAPTPAPAPAPAPAPTPAPAPSTPSDEIPWFLRLTPVPAPR
ncbi:MAG: peptidoglycan-binding protein [bacterium]|nr:peptidoglycan-binding protein [bacterium]